jgi:rubrerythrin
MVFIYLARYILPAHAGLDACGAREKGLWRRQKNISMSQVSDRIVELVRAALDFEFGGERLYRHLAELTQHRAGRAMFLRLAEDERRHVGESHALFAALVGEEEWQRLSSREAGEPNVTGIVAELEAAVLQRGHAAVADDTQALRMAMELERRAIHMYQEMAEHTDDPVQLKLLGKLVQEEFYHYDNLQAQLDSILNVGLWLDQPEFRMDGKF